MLAALQLLQWQRRDKLMMSCWKGGHKRCQCVPGLHETQACGHRGSFKQSHGMSITAVWYGWRAATCSLCAVPPAL